MKCPICNKNIPDETIVSEAASINGKKKSEKKAKSSAENGRKHIGKEK